MRRVSVSYAAALEEKPAEENSMQDYLQNREDLAATVKQLAKLIGDRDGLESLESLFDATELDGSGTLSPDEFAGLIRKFEARNLMAGEEQNTATTLSDGDIRGLFDLFDASGDGLLSFEEFSQAQKAEMEWLEIQNRFAGVDF